MLNFLIFRHYSVQRVNHNVTLKLPDDILTGSKNKEIIVGGVYLRLFNKNPGWVLRKPKEFLSELLDTSVKEIPKDPTNVSEVIFSFVSNVSC